jgi:hypothetical protein
MDLPFSSVMSQIEMAGHGFCRIADRLGVNPRCAEHELAPGLHEALVTGALNRRLAELVDVAVSPDARPLARRGGCGSFLAAHRDGCGSCN